MAHNAAVYKASDHMESKIDENKLAYFGFPVWEFVSEKVIVSLHILNTFHTTPYTTHWE
jgi:hypothetical protein